jgi:putative transposase
LTARAHAVIACDFLVVETVLLKRLHVLVFYRARHPEVAPGRGNRTTEAWAVQQARNLAMDLDDRLGTMRFKSEGLRIITTLPRTPWMNATCERFIWNPAPRDAGPDLDPR